MQKQHVLEGTLENSGTITDPEEDQEERNEGDAEGGYANKERLTIVLPLKALEGRDGTRCIVILLHNLT